MSQSEESINLLSPSLDDRCSRATKHNKKMNHQSHDDENNTESKSNGVIIPEERTNAKSHRAIHPKRRRVDETNGNRNDMGDPTATNAKESKFASRRDYTKDYTRKAPANEPSKRPSDEFLRRALPFRTTRKNVRLIDSISKDMEVSLILNSTVEVPILDEADDRGGGCGGVLSQLTCLEGGTQMYTGRRDDDDEEDDGKEFLLDRERQEHSAQSEIRDLPKDDDDVDVFEFEDSQQKQTAKSSAESKSKHVKVKTRSAAAKRRRKGPTEKALAECNDLTRSMDKEMESIDDVEYENNVDFVNHEDDKDPLEQNPQTIQNSQTQHPSSPQQRTSQRSPIQTTSQTHPPKSTQTAQQTILTNYTAIENMSRALTCPICCHSLKSATFLPCGHAFCKSCLSSSFSASAPGGPGVGSCPVCRHKCGKRSMMPIAQLDEIVKAYKGIMRAFGFAPVVFSKKVMMTQLSPGEDGEWEEGEEEGRESLGGRKKKRRLDVEEALEHHQVVLSNHAAFANFEKQQAAPTAPAQNKFTSGNRMTKEELERINLMRRYQILTRDQEAILQADKEALERATRRKQKIAEETAAFALNGGVKVSTEYTVRERGSERELTTAGSEPVGDQRKLPPASAAMESQDTFHTAKSGYSTFQETRQPRRSSAVTAPSPTILHDGNTAKKTEKDRSLTSSVGPSVGQVKERALEPRDETDNTPLARKRVVKGGTTRNLSFSTVGSPIVLHDGNTTQKMNKSEITPKWSGKLPQPALTDSENNKAKTTATVVAFDNDEPLDNADFDTEGFEASQHSSVVSEESVKEPPAVDNELRSPSKEESIVEGSVVMVQARTWPGINKHGGVGRVTRVDSSGHSKKYDVAYILGGKEKGVDESFVSLHEPERSDTAGLTVAGRVSKSAEKASSRQIRKRISASKGTEPSVSIPIYNDDELQHIPVDVLAWAGIVRPVKGVGGTPKRKGSKSNGVANARVPSKKRVLVESNTNVVLSKKPKKEKVTNSRASMLQERNSKAKADHANGPFVTFQTATESLTSDELVNRADARYSSLLSCDNDSSVTIYAITSGLSDQDAKVLSSFVKTLKSKNVTLKVTKDFKPGKTHLCITPASSAVGSQESNIVSKSRTLKVMRSALLGLPILTPRWMESCISDERIVAPHGDMCVRSLPRKGTIKDDDLARFGVAKYAAAMDDNISKVLNKCAVLLCGEWKSTGQSTMRDLKVLLQDAGATMVNSESVALKLLEDISHDDASSDYIVFLCDDSHLDLDCGVSESLFNAGKLAIAHNQSSRRKVLAVHFHWLFDCISCAKVMPGAPYTPLAPRTKDLWSLCCESDEQGNDTV